MHEDLVNEIRAAEPPASLRRIHDLDDLPVTPPGDEKVEHVVRLASDKQGRQRSRRGQQQMIDRNHDLLGLEAEPNSDLLDEILLPLATFMHVLWPSISHVLELWHEDHSMNAIAAL